MYNNPGNIRYNPAIPGVIGENEKGFSIFKTEAAGIRAIYHLLKVYGSKYGLKTISGIISRYAPSSENQTGKYIDFVATKTGFGKNEILSPADLVKLLRPIIKMESGRDFSQATIDQALGGEIDETPSRDLLPLLAIGLLFAPLFLKSK